jgi:hypothetical protein
VADVSQIRYANLETEKKSSHICPYWPQILVNQPGSRPGRQPWPESGLISVFCFYSGLDIWFLPQKYAKILQEKYTYQLTNKPSCGKFEVIAFFLLFFYVSDLKDQKKDEKSNVIHCS